MRRRHERVKSKPLPSNEPMFSAEPLHILICHPRVRQISLQRGVWSDPRLPRGRRANHLVGEQNRGQSRCWAVRLRGLGIQILLPEDSLLKRRLIAAIEHDNRSQTTLVVPSAHVGEVVLTCNVPHLQGELGLCVPLNRLHTKVSPNLCVSLLDQAEKGRELTVARYPSVVAPLLLYLRMIPETRQFPARPLSLPHGTLSLVFPAFIGPMTTNLS